MVSLRLRLSAPCWNIYQVLRSSVTRCYAYRRRSSSRLPATSGCLAISATQIVAAELLRLVCTATYDAALRPFARLFSFVSVCFNSKSLRRLKGLASHPRLGKEIQKLSVGTQRLVPVERLAETRHQYVGPKTKAAFDQRQTLAAFINEVHGCMCQARFGISTSSQGTRNIASD